VSAPDPKADGQRKSLQKAANRAFIEALGIAWDSVARKQVEFTSDDIRERFNELFPNPDFHVSWSHCAGAVATMKLKQNIATYADKPPVQSRIPGRRHSRQIVFRSLVYMGNGCDCENPSQGLMSNECPIHNERPFVGWRNA